MAMERLTALWALNESGLGGIMHAAKLPFSGMIVGGFAVILISLIGYFAENKFASIIKATIVVLLVKFVMSPHSPLQAYFAVSFQGILGAILFDKITYFKIGAMMLAVTSLLESAIQKLLMLTVLYGTSFWKAINLFYKYIAGEFSIKNTNINGSEILIGAYVGLYLAGGMVVGWLAGIFPAHINRLSGEDEPIKKLRILYSNNKPVLISPSINSKKENIIKSIIIPVLIIFSFVPFSVAAYGFMHGVYLFIRVIIILALWYFLLAPFLMKLLRKLLKKKSKMYFNDVDNAIKILPFLVKMAKFIWHESANKKGIKRLDYFFSTLVVFTLFYTQEDFEIITTHN